VTTSPSSAVSFLRYPMPRPSSGVSLSPFSTGWRPRKKEMKWEKNRRRKIKKRRKRWRGESKSDRSTSQCWLKGAQINLTGVRRKRRNWASKPNCKSPGPVGPC
jgi:hypothetical protein